MARTVFALICLLSLPSTNLHANPVEGSLSELRIEVLKSARRMNLYSGDRLLRSHPVGLGFDPVSDKRRQGDGATPEGEYFVCIKNPWSQFYLSLGINYPNSVDARRGLASGLISEAESEAIRRSEERKVCPDWNTRLGGEIFVHGRGSGTDWTAGCVALDDGPMKDLFEATVVGARVTIKP